MERHCGMLAGAGGLCRGKDQVLRWGLLEVGTGAGGNKAPLHDCLGLLVAPASGLGTGG